MLILALPRNQWRSRPNGLVMRDRNARGGDILDRFLCLSVAIVRLIERLPKGATTRHIGLQLVRAVTSAGANYQEARHAESRADFVHKVSVAAKEIAETLYWLRLVDKLGVTAVGPHMKEADELVAILVASTNTARAGI
ncbi:MAG TPA: four helix bundle protein [Labilithrix sp.]|nr:four helix bundle protein [Labilithrix sp.]